MVLKYYKKTQSDIMKFARCCQITDQATANEYTMERKISNFNSWSYNKTDDTRHHVACKFDVPQLNVNTLALSCSHFNFRISNVHFTFTIANHRYNIM